jgi:hypothetical protein
MEPLGVWAVNACALHCRRTSRVSLASRQVDCDGGDVHPSAPRACCCTRTAVRPWQKAAPRGDVCCWRWGLGPAQGAEPGARAQPAGGEAPLQPRRSAVHRRTADRHSRLLQLLAPRLVGAFQLARGCRTGQVCVARLRGCHPVASASSHSRRPLTGRSPALGGERAAAEQAPMVVLDGANLLWAYGHALARRFGCKVYPASAGLLVALNYEVRGRSGVVLRVACASSSPVSPRLSTPPLLCSLPCVTHLHCVALLTAVAGCWCAHHSAAALQLRALPRPGLGR